MRLQSLPTLKFDAAELQRLAKRTRPRPAPGILAWAAAGLLIGLAIVGLFRALT